MYILMINKAIKYSSFFVIFLGLFSKRNTKHFLRVFIELWRHSWGFGGARKGCGNTRLRLVFPQHFSFSQTSTRVSVTRWKHGKCFLFLKYNHSAKRVHCDAMCITLKAWNVVYICLLVAICLAMLLVLPKIVILKKLPMDSITAPFSRHNWGRKPVCRRQGLEAKILTS